MQPLLRFWWQHLRVPLMVFLLLASLLATSRADLAIADALFFDPAHMRWVGAHSWWSNELLHTGGRWFIRALVAAALLLWTGAGVHDGLRGLRRPAAYFVVSVILSVGTVGLLKMLTHVDCPWDLAHYGGRFPFVGLFGHRLDALRPDSLPRARCFPAAHAGSGYALLALYFALRERSIVLARLGLGCGLVTGLIFGIAQQSRGAHFVSHDLWSVFLVWAISLSVYTFAFKARLWNGVRQTRAGFQIHDAPVAAGKLVAGGTAAVRERAGGLARAARR